LERRIHHPLVFLWSYDRINHPSVVPLGQFDVSHCKLHGSYQRLRNQNTDEYHYFIGYINWVRTFHSHIVCQLDGLLFGTKNPFHWLTIEKVKKLPIG